MAWNEQEFSATLLGLHGGETVAIGAALSTTLNFLTKVHHTHCLARLVVTASC